MGKVVAFRKRCSHNYKLLTKLDNTVYKFNNIDRKILSFIYNSPNQVIPWYEIMIEFGINSKKIRTCDITTKKFKRIFGHINNLIDFGFIESDYLCPEPEQVCQLCSLYRIGIKKFDYRNFGFECVGNLMISVGLFNSFRV
jgi:hypothetical protein